MMTKFFTIMLLAFTVEGHGPMQSVPLYRG